MDKKGNLDRNNSLFQVGNNRSQEVAIIQIHYMMYAIGLDMVWMSSKGLCVEISSHCETVRGWKLNLIIFRGRYFERDIRVIRVEPPRLSFGFIRKEKRPVYMCMCAYLLFFLQCLEIPWDSATEKPDLQNYEPE